MAILGAGRWGVHFIRHFLRHPQAAVVAVVDPHPDRLAACQQQFDQAGREVNLATNWESVRQLPNIDAVVVATPASTHYPLIADALQLGCHVLAEKPLALTVTECLELTQLAERQQRQLFVDHTYLFHPAVARGTEVVQSGKLGELRYGYASRTHLGPVRQDVDALWDLAIHDLAIFNTWLGQVPSQVQAEGRVWLQPERKVGNSDSPNHEAAAGLADLVWGKLTYPDGFEAHLHWCWNNPDKQRRLCLVGTQGSLIFDELSPASPLILQQGYLERQGEQFLPAGQRREVLPVEEAEPLQRVCDRFLTEIRQPTPCWQASGAIAAQLVQVLGGLSFSLQQGGKIVPLSS